MKKNVNSRKQCQAEIPESEITNSTYRAVFQTVLWTTLSPRDPAEDDNNPSFCWSCINSIDNKKLWRRTDQNSFIATNLECLRKSLLTSSSKPISITPLIIAGLKSKFKVKISAVDPIMYAPSSATLSWCMEAMMWKKVFLGIFIRWIFLKIANNLFGRNRTIYAKTNKLN